MNGLGFSVSRVLAGIDAAAAEGFPIKVNCVVQRGVNDGEIIALCDYFRAQGPHAPLHRVHGRGKHEPLVAVAGGARARDRRAGLGGLAPGAGRARPTGARSPRATATPTAGERSGS